MLKEIRNESLNHGAFTLGTVAGVFHISAPYPNGQQPALATKSIIRTGIFRNAKCETCPQQPTCDQLPFLKMTMRVIQRHFRPRRLYPKSECPMGAVSLNSLDFVWRIGTFLRQVKDREAN